MGKKTGRDGIIAWGHTDMVDPWDFIIETNMPYHPQTVSFNTTLCNNCAISFNQNLML